MNTILLNILGGIISGLIAAGIYAIFMSRFKPKIIVSDKIMFGSRLVRYADEQVGIIKIVHRNKTALTNFEVVMHFLTPNAKGYGYSDVIIHPTRELPSILPGYDKSNEEMCELWIAYDNLREKDLMNGAEFYLTVKVDYKVMDTTKTYITQQKYTEQSFTRDIFKKGYTVETVSI